MAAQNLLESDVNPSPESREERKHRGRPPRAGRPQLKDEGELDGDWKTALFRHGGWLAGVASGLGGMGLLIAAYFVEPMRDNALQGGGLLFFGVILLVREMLPKRNRYRFGSKKRWSRQVEHRRLDLTRKIEVAGTELTRAETESSSLAAACEQLEAEVAMLCQWEVDERAAATAKLAEQQPDIAEEERERLKAEIAAHEERAGEHSANAAQKTCEIRGLRKRQAELDAAAADLRVVSAELTAKRDKLDARQKEGNQPSRRRRPLLAGLGLVMLAALLVAGIFYVPRLHIAELSASEALEAFSDQVDPNRLEGVTVTGGFRQRWGESLHCLVLETGDGRIQAHLIRADEGTKNAWRDMVIAEARAELKGEYEGLDVRLISSRQPHRYSAADWYETSTIACESPSQSRETVFWSCWKPYGLQKDWLVIVGRGEFEPSAIEPILRCLGR